LIAVGLRLVVARCLVAPRLSSARHRADDSADGRALARIPRDRTNGETAHGPARGSAGALTAPRRGAGLLRHRLRRKLRWIDTRRFLRPRAAIRLVALLDLRALAACGVNDRLLGYGAGGRQKRGREERQPNDSSRWLKRAHPTLGKKSRDHAGAAPLRNSSSRSRKLFAQ
jgi:hypothetical protein